MDGIGERVGRARTLRGWSVRELARRSRVSNTQIGAIERGESHPQDRTIEALARGLGVSEAALREGPLPEPLGPPPLHFGRVREVRRDRTQGAAAAFRPNQHAPALLAPLSTGPVALAAPEQAPRVELPGAFGGVYFLQVIRQEYVGASWPVGLASGEEFLAVRDVVAVPVEIGAGRNLRAVRVQGACMEPEISAGDIVIVELDRVPHDGEVAIVNYQGQTLIKRWWAEGGGVVELEANRLGDSLRVQADELTVYGVVISGQYKVRRMSRRQRHRPD